MQVTVRHDMPVNADRWWRGHYFDRGFLTHNYVEQQGFASIEFVELHFHPGGTSRRHIRYVKKLDFPRALARLVEDTITIEERGEMGPDGRMRFDIQSSSRLSNRVQMGGTLWVEPRAGGITRVSGLTYKVNVLGVGGLLEKLIARNNDEYYAMEARLVADYAAAHPAEPASSPDARA